MKNPRAIRTRWSVAGAFMALALVAPALAQKTYIKGITTVVNCDINGAWVSLTVDAPAGARSVVMTAAGPGYAVFGATGTVSDPQLEVYDQTGTRVAYNDDSTLSFLETSFPLQAKDAGLRVTLTTGVYAVRISGVGGATGTAYLDISDAGAQPAFISVGLLSRLAAGVFGQFLVNLSGEGNTQLATFVSGPNLPITSPFSDPRFQLVSNPTTLATIDTYTSSVGTTADRFFSPLTGNVKNAGHVFPWTINTAAGMTQSPQIILQDLQPIPATSGAFLLEVHDLDSSTLRRPTILVPPLSSTVSAGGTLTLRVVAGGELARTFQWQRDGVDLPGATLPTYTMANIAPADAGSYRVKVTSSIGTTISPPATVAVQAVTPTISVQPQNTTVTSGQVATLSVTAAGGNLTYQWRRNGTNISGATSATLTLSATSESDAGTYTVLVTNTVGTVLSNAATLTVQSANPGRLVNLSVRAFAGTDDRTLIVGFALGGTGSKRIVIRGIGPTLADFGVAAPLADPRLGIFFGSTEIMSNDNWTNLDGRDVGGFPLATGSKDAVISNNFDARTLSAQVTGINRGTGEALVELYDGAPGNTALRLVNLSARTQLDDGQRLIVGMTITGATSKGLVMRAVGPALAGFGLTTAHPDPRVELYADGVKIAENDQWSGDYGASSGAFPLTVGSKDAVLVRSLAPGGYSLHVLGATGTSGVILVELYEVP